eukprot:1059003-Pelagomonas_calceolata.AAC.5
MCIYASLFTCTVSALSKHRYVCEVITSLWQFKDIFEFKEGSLSVGENSCVDRCCAKYWQVVAIVGQLLGAQK